MAHGRTTPGKGLGGRNRGRNRQLPDDVRGVYGAVLPARPVYRHPTGHPGLGRGDQGESRGVPGQGDSEPWQYVMTVLHAETGTSMEGALYSRAALGRRREGRVLRYEVF